jgi:hypothetical protein
MFRKTHDPSAFSILAHRRARRLIIPCRCAPLLCFPALFLNCQSKSLDLDSQQSVVVVTVSAEADLDSGVDGTLGESMSTAFQAAPWQREFFARHPEEADSGTSSLGPLSPEHVLVQMYNSPLIGDSPDASYWDFSELDAIVQPLLALGEDPLLQIASMPQWLSANDPDGFAEYCANIVRYYNSPRGLALPDGGLLRSSAGRGITWWAILSDPNTGTTPISGDVYAILYKTALAQMTAASGWPLRFAAPELNDCTDPVPVCDPRQSGFLSSFLNSVIDGGVDGGEVPLDALSIHMFSTSSAVSVDAGLAPDTTVLQTIARFTDDVGYFKSELRRVNRTEVPIWITQNQVNSDTPTVDGGSGHGEGMPAFQADPRGTNAFFAAWRPSLFAALGKVGNRFLGQWQHTAGRCPALDAGCSTLASADTDRQNAEIDYVSGAKYISYWVDAALAQKLPPGGVLTKLTVVPSAAPTELRALASWYRSGPHETLVIMIINQTPLNASSTVGVGGRASAIVDLRPFLTMKPSALGSWSATELSIDTGTDLQLGPKEAAISLGPGWVPVVFSGYGVVFITLSR